MDQNYFQSGAEALVRLHLRDDLLRLHLLLPGRLVRRHPRLVRLPRLRRLLHRRLVLPRGAQGQGVPATQAHPSQHTGPARRPGHCACRASCASGASPTASNGYDEPTCLSSCDTTAIPAADTAACLSASADCVSAAACVSATTAAAECPNNLLRKEFLKYTGLFCLFLLDGDNVVILDEAVVSGGAPRFVAFLAHFDASPALDLALAAAVAGAATVDLRGHIDLKGPNVVL